jgi:copper homeostasis protein (lipoprotein)
LQKEIKLKKAIVAAMAAFSLFALIGCNNRAEVESLQQTRAAELKPMPQSWRGVLPCADCEGIELSLFLEKDGTWVMNQRYQGARAAGATFATYGTWARTADKLVLTDSKGDRSYYRAKGDALEMLDREGNPITSQFNYTLKPVKASLPVTPMPMRGMYLYMADAATFTDCATGKTIPVANTLELERGYLATREAPEKPVLLSVEGHFMQDTGMEEGQQIKVLAVDKMIKFMPGKGCGD